MAKNYTDYTPMPEAWPDIHMASAQGVQAHFDLQEGAPAGVMLPIHWEPSNWRRARGRSQGIGRRTRQKRRGQAVAFPRPGEPLQVTCLNGAVVSFRWRNHRRNLRSCRRTQFLDLGRLTPDGPAVVLRIEQFNEDGTGLGSLISHHSTRLWMTCGIKYRPLTEVPEIPQQRAKAVA